MGSVIDGLWKVSGGEKLFWLLMSTGLPGGGSVCEGAGSGKGGCGRQDGVVGEFAVFSSGVWISFCGWWRGQRVVSSSLSRCLLLCLVPGSLQTLH